MIRIGFLGRLMLILMAALLAMIAINAGLDHLSKRNRLPGRNPRLAHAAGIIALMRGADARQQQRIARLGQAGIVHVDIVDKAPEQAPTDIVAPNLKSRMLKFFGISAPGLQVFTNERMKLPASLRGIEGSLTKVILPLDGGRILVIQWMDPPEIVDFKLLGLPPSIWAGILGFAVAALALLGASREMRPLRRLADAVSRFDGAPPRTPFDETGAPDVRRLVRAVREMQQRVATLLGERSFLIGAISHDLRSFLTRLRLRAEAVADAEARERLIGDLDAMSRLIDTSLAFARATTSADNRSRIDLGDLVAVEVEEHAALGPNAKLEGTYADHAIVAGDPVALRRVVANVLDNALKFARSAVKVRVERTPTHERILIEDDGPGIPETQRELVFDPFYSADDRPRANGTGLGLAIARQIVEAHGGTIEVGSAMPGGAAFVIALPACGA